MALLSAPFTPQPGKIVIYGEWTGSEYVEYQGYIRTIQSTPGGPNEPTINLSYSTGVNLAQANNVENIEIADLGANDDYWRAQFDPQPEDSKPPTITRPPQGAVIWLAIFNGVGHDNRLGFVRAVLGAPTDLAPSLAVSYWDPVGAADVNANSVVQAYDEDAETDDYWFDQQSVV